MFEFIRTHAVRWTGPTGAGRVWQWLQRQPNWFVRAACAAIFIAVSIPIAAILIVTLLIAGAFIVLLWTIVFVASLVQRGFATPGSGRRNVKVIGVTRRGQWTGGTRAGD